MRRTLIENHGDIRTQQALDGHAFLGTQKQGRAIEVRTELHAVRFNFADFGEAEDLETTAVGENGQLPVHELVQAAGGGDDVETGADVKVIGVAKNDLGAAFQQFTRVHGLDTGLGAHGHINRGIHDPVGGGQAAEPSLRLGISFEELKHPAEDN